MQAVPWIMTLIFLLGALLLVVELLRLNRANKEFHERLTVMCGRYYDLQGENTELKKHLGM